MPILLSPAFYQKIWKALYLHGCLVVCSDVTVAFEDAQVIPLSSREETENTYETDDLDDTDDTDDTDNTNITYYTDDTDDK